VQVASVLEQTATRPAVNGWLPTTGWGIVNARAALESVLGRKAVDALSLSSLRVAGARTPGTPLTATVRATWNDEMPVVAGATPTCNVTVGGKAVRSKVTLGTGILSCTCTVPAGSAGEHVAGLLSLTAPALPAATARFAFGVRRRR
jgi:hypothetical protein